MKQFLIVFFSFVVGYTVQGQKNIDFINQQVSNVEVQLIKKGEHLKLNNEQLNALSKIFDEKYKRVQMVLSKFIEKSEVSREMTKVEDEFTPKVEALLSFEQRYALQQSDKRKTPPAPTH